MSTSVGAKVLTIKQAIIAAAIFEAAGAFLASGEVTHTIRGKIINLHWFVDKPEIFVYGMLAALLAAGTWLLVATYLGWPVSTTHSIVGAIVGFGVVGINVEAVNWDVVGNIMLSWVVTPFISGILAYLLFMSIQKFIFDAKRPLYNSRHYLPMYIFLMGFIITSVTLVKGLKHLGGQ
jgi:PiT family inorganic phosphate transporter